jgi:hypothetical protein
MKLFLLLLLLLLIFGQMLDADKQCDTMNMPNCPMMEKK